MVHIALKIHQRGTLLQNTVPVALIQRIHEGLLVSVALADVHIVPDTDDIGHEGHHVRRFPDSLAVGDLALFLLKVLRLKAQQVAGRGKGETGAGGIIPENRDSKAGIEDAGRSVPFPQVPQGIGHRENGLQFLIGFIPSPVKIGLIHIVDVQAL